MQSEIRFRDEETRVLYNNFNPETEGSAGYDLRYVPRHHGGPGNPPSKIGIPPGGTVVVETGVSIWLRDSGLVGLVVPRSGLGAREGLILANGTGVIDSDYQGEILATLWNRSEHNWITVVPGQRIIQILFMPVVHPDFLTIRTEFSRETRRGTGKLGSTGW